MTTWTRFMDMSSGGGRKEDWDFIYIEAGEDEAKSIFYAKFDHSPERVTCTCCGDDYSISEEPTLEEATGYERGCHFDDKLGRYVDKPAKREFSNEYKSLEDYISSKGVLVIRDSDIKPEWRTADVPEQGYVWQD